MQKEDEKKRTLPPIFGEGFIHIPDHTILSRAPVEQPQESLLELGNTVQEVADDLVTNHFQDVN